MSNAAKDKDVEAEKKFPEDEFKKFVEAYEKFLERQKQKDPGLKSIHAHALGFDADGG